MLNSLMWATQTARGMHRHSRHGGSIQQIAPPNFMDRYWHRSTSYKCETVGCEMFLHNLLQNQHKAVSHQAQIISTEMYKKSFHVLQWKLAHQGRIFITTVTRGGWTSEIVCMLSHFPNTSDHVNGITFISLQICCVLHDHNHTNNRR